MKARLDVRVASTGADVFVFFGGIKIAKCGHPGTPQAKTWISPEAGWEVLDAANGDLLVRRQGVRPFVRQDRQRRNAFLLKEAETASALGSTCHSGTMHDGSIL